MVVFLVSVARLVHCVVILCCWDYFFDFQLVCSEFFDVSGVKYGNKGGYTGVFFGGLLFCPGLEKQVIAGIYGVGF